MVDLQKLDSVIDDLSESTANFVKVSDITEKVKKTVLIVDKSVSNLGNVVNEVHELNKNQSAIQEKVSATYQNLEEHFKSVQLQNAQFTSQVNTLLLEIKNEGHALNKQLEDVLVTKLEIMKSDIILENRIKALETQDKITESYNELVNTKKELAQTLELVSKKLMISYAIGGAGILIAVITMLLTLLR